MSVASPAPQRRDDLPRHGGRVRARAVRGDAQHGAHRRTGQRHQAGRAPGQAADDRGGAREDGV